MQKNTSSQKIALFAFTIATGAAKTGDAANLTAYVSKDFGAVTVLGDTSATEMDATNAPGWYLFDLTQAETNGDALLFTAKSSTSGVSVVGRPIDTTPANFTSASIDSSGRIDVGKWLGTAVSTPTVAGVPNVNVKTWNDLTTVALPLVPTVAGRALDVSAGGEAGLDWANVGSPTTALVLTGTTIATTQKVDVETIKTNPVVNAGTITFPTAATLASTTNITAGTITTVTNLTNAPTAGDLTAAMIASVTAAATAATPTAAAVTGAVGSVTGNVGGNVLGSVASVTGLTASNLDATVSSRLASASYTAPPSAATNATAVRTELGTELGCIDVATSTRLASGTVASDVTAVKAKTDNLPSHPADESLIIAATNSLAALIGTPAVTVSADIAGLPTATQNADGLLKRDMSAVTGEAARSPLNAFRAIRNKWSISGTTQTICKEDDATTAWTTELASSASADPVTGSDPA